MKRSLFGTLIWKTFISILRRCVENFSYGFKTLVKFDIKITTGFARGGQGRGVVVRCTRLLHSIGALCFARGFQKECFATPLRGISGHFASLVVSNKKCSTTSFRGLSGHFASLVVSKKVPANCWDFYFFPQKSGC